ncbi:hypothetical protein ACTM8Z_09250, partial [Atopobiaceae bacterium HCP3S3_D6]
GTRSGTRPGERTRRRPEGRRDHAARRAHLRRHAASFSNYARLHLLKTKGLQIHKPKLNRA